MKLLRRWLIRLAGGMTTRRVDQRLTEEIEQHLELQTAANISAGMSPDEARRQAVLKFGAIESVKESYRDGQRLRFLDDLFHDTRYAVRTLRKTPGFTVVAI